ncbi:zinc-dependent alcohol dehydrogenase family protein [Pseudomonadota bacterium]
MLAYVLSEYGESGLFQKAEILTPQLKPGHVLIRVAATSVNPVDTKIRAGGRAMCPDQPAVLHMDVAGTVEAVGRGVTEFKVGEEVYGCAGGLKTVAGENLGGALAEFMLADVDLIAHKPKSLTMSEAAALPLVTITAWEMIFNRTSFEKGANVLVHAGTGGVGHVAVQLAKYSGAKVFTTVSSDEKAAIARELGADTIINYRESTVDEYVKECTGDNNGFDLILDTVGGDNLDRSLQAVKVNGSVSTIIAMNTHDLTPMHLKGLSLHVVFMLIPMLYGVGRAAHGEILRSAATLVDNGYLRPLIDTEVFEYGQADLAHKKLLSGTALGKIVLKYS